MSAFVPRPIPFANAHAPFAFQPEPIRLANADQPPQLLVHQPEMNLLLYVDPGSGLLVWQLVFSAFVGALFYIKKFRTALGKVARRLIRKR
jgi:hypothetical protein